VWVKKLLQELIHASSLSSLNSVSIIERFLASIGDLSSSFNIERAMTASAQKVDREQVDEGDAHSSKVFAGSSNSPLILVVSVVLLSLLLLLLLLPSMFSEYLKPGPIPG
jgi:hypothetical protein